MEQHYDSFGFMFLSFRWIKASRQKTVTCSWKWSYESEWEQKAASRTLNDEPKASKKSSVKLRGAADSDSPPAKMLNISKCSLSNLRTIVNWTCQGVGHLLTFLTFNTQKTCSRSVSNEKSSFVTALHCIYLCVSSETFNQPSLSQQFATDSNAHLVVNTMKENQIRWRLRYLCIFYWQMFTKRKLHNNRNFSKLIYSTKKARKEI